MCAAAFFAPHPPPGGCWCERGPAPAVLRTAMRSGRARGSRSPSLPPCTGLLARLSPPLPPLFCPQNALERLGAFKVDTHGLTSRAVCVSTRCLRRRVSPTPPHPRGGVARLSTAARGCGGGGAGSSPRPPLLLRTRVCQKAALPPFLYINQSPPIPPTFFPSTFFPSPTAVFFRTTRPPTRPIKKCLFSERLCFVPCVCVCVCVCVRCVCVACHLIVERTRNKNNKNFFPNYFFLNHYPAPAPAPPPPLPAHAPAPASSATHSVAA